METVGVVIVLLVVLGIFGGVGFLFMRETGTTDLREQARLWLTAPKQLRRSTSPATAASSHLPGHNPTNGSGQSMRRTDGRLDPSATGISGRRRAVPGLAASCPN